MEPTATRTVPFVDLKRQYEPLKPEIFKALERVFDSCRFIGGEEVKRFEEEFAAWTGVREVVGCGCATDGLFAVMKVLGLGPGDEVLTTAHTATATAEAVTLTGARVVFCDTVSGTFNMDPEDAERRITDRTKALIVVHLYGQPADMDRFCDIARRFGLFLIEDCSQAHGARYRGRRVGTFGDAAVFSFFPSKPVGGFGDGGAVAAKDPDLLVRIRMFCNHGRLSKFDHRFEGMNSRLDAIQAAVLRVLLPHVDQWNAQRRSLAALYTEELSGIDGLELPEVLDEVEPVWHVYAVRVPDRDRLRRYLQERGVGTGIHYPLSLNLLPAYGYLGQGRGSFQRAEYNCEHTLSLPLFPAMTEEELRYVCKAVRDFFETESC